MEVTHELMNEHQLILKYINLIERYISFSHINKEDNFILEKAQDFVDFIKTFTDRYHHVKEEDILFKYLQAPSVLSHCNPLPVMLSEHELSRIFIQKMTDAIATENKQEFCTNASNYSQLLQQHIIKEEKILYPMAEEGISNDDKTSLKEEYIQTEEKLNKRQIWNKFEKLYSELDRCLESKVAGHA